MAHRIQQKSLAEFNLNVQNLVSVTDNCHVMRGEHGGLFALLSNSVQEKIVDVHQSMAALCTLFILPQNMVSTQ